MNIFAIEEGYDFRKPSSITCTILNFGTLSPQIHKMLSQGKCVLYCLYLKFDSLFTYTDKI